MKTTRSELVSIINSLNLNLKNDYYRNAYEDAENLFVLTQHPHFFNVVLYCKYMFSIYYKSIFYLTSACNNGSIREYLRAIYFILERKMDLALESFGKSSKYSKDPLEEVSLFNIEITNDLIIFEEEMNTIPGAARQNTHALSKISHLSYRGFLIKLTDAYSPKVDDRGKIIMNRALEATVPISVKEPEKTETRQKPRYPIEEPHRIEAEVDEPADQNIWHKDKDDDIWRISYEGKPAIIQDLVGLTYISHLLQDPFKEFPLSELDELVNPGKVDIDSPAVKKLGTEESYDIFSSDGKKPRYEKTTDRKSIESYKKEIKRLEVKIDHAESTENYDEAELLREEKESIEGHIDNSTSFVSKKPLLTVPELELIRKRIYNDVRYSIKIINKKHKPLANHLRQFIKIRKYSKYVPSPEISWDIQL